eukprot:TRINITY_DN1929_c0_g1_i1.p1 TRINITY_DN1929_c0_g1~~TRINITY_DN1929_c0_g1_i1.p1  ORF type:complete len:491 (-),score=69.16 TRINITY_DN1929_c0_g1_i1:44-1516(-)
MSREHSSKAHSNAKASSEDAKKAEEIKGNWSAIEPRRFVLLAGTVLAGCAGYINAAALLTGGANVSHVTGLATKLGLGLEGYYLRDWDHARKWEAGCLIMSFFVGAFTCGLLVARSEVHFGKSMYGVALMLNSALLFSSMWVVTSAQVPNWWPVFFGGRYLSLYLQACACGLQNGMCTAHFGAIVRTTHLTGIVTDCGLSVGRLVNVLCRRRCRMGRFSAVDSAEVRIDVTKLRVFTSLLLGFISGVFIGAYLQRQLGVNCFAVPATITGLGGLAYSVAKARCWEWFQRAEASRLAEDLAEIEEIFERTRQQLEVVRQSQGLAGGVNGDHGATEDDRRASMDEIGAHMGHALERLHDLEASIQEVQENVRTVSSKSIVPSPTRSRLASDGSASTLKDSSSQTSPMCSLVSPNLPERSRPQTPPRSRAHRTVAGYLGGHAPVPAPALNTLLPRTPQHDVFLPRQPIQRSIIQQAALGGSRLASGERQPSAV